MAISINYVKTHLPLSKIKGTPQARLNQAIKMSDNFFENVKGAFGYQHLTTGLLTNIFKKSLNSEIGIKVFGNPNVVNESSTKLALKMGKNIPSEISGYEVHLPIDDYSRCLDKNSIKLIMKEAFDVFYKVTNPKINQREIKLLNKHYDLKELTSLTREKALSPKKMEEIDLDKLLTGRGIQEKIDLLQEFRNYLKQKFYTLENSAKYQLKNDKIIKLKRTTIIHKPHTSFNLPEKIKLIENKLAQTIKNERARIANS